MVNGFGFVLGAALATQCLGDAVVVCRIKWEDESNKAQARVAASSSNGDKQLINSGHAVVEGAAAATEVAGGVAAEIQARATARV